MSEDKDFQKVMDDVLRVMNRRLVDTGIVIYGEGGRAEELASIARSVRAILDFDQDHG